ncbi:transcriptional repressor, partial [Serendipita sp. 411]
MPAQVNAVDAAGADYGKAIQSKKKKPTFECPHCSRKFATRSHLVRHSRVHTGERRYACDYPGCEMRCSRKDNLQQHYRTHLVVNPRRANAQSMLSAGAASGTTATAGGSHEAANDPEAQDVSIHRHNNNNNNNNGAGEYTSDPTRLMGSPTDLKPIPSDPSQPPLDNHHNHNHNHGLGAHLQTASHLDVAHHHDPTSAGANPDRDWSLSPPPPLSSAYDYWYAHGCLPHTVRNPASVSGSGSSGATSPELSNALELAPGQGGQQQQHAHHSHSHPHSHHHHPAPPHHPHHAPPPHHHSHMHPTHHHHHPQQPGPPQHHLPPVHTAHHPHPHPHQQQQQQQQRHSYVESPTGYYHSHHNMPNTAGGYSSYDGGEGGAATMRTSFSLGTATFPSPADYHHPAAPPPPTTAAHHGHPHHSHHQRSNSYSRMGGGGGYESATTSPHISNAHLHHAPHSGLPAPPTRHHSYPNGTDSYAVAAAAAAASYHNSPTEYKFHPPPQQQHVYPGPSSVSGNESRPVTRHGSMTATATTSGYTTVPVYPSHPHATAQTTMGYG